MLHSFTSGPDGAYPAAPLMHGSDGAFYVSKHARTPSPEMTATEHSFQHTVFPLMAGHSPKQNPRFSWLSDSGKARNIQLQPIIGGACLGVSAQGVVTKPLKFPAFSS
jgi:hypothetical protein